MQGMGNGEQRFTSVLEKKVEQLKTANQRNSAEELLSKVQTRTG